MKLSEVPRTRPCSQDRRTKTDTAQLMGIIASDDVEWLDEDGMDTTTLLLPPQTIPSPGLPVMQDSERCSLPWEQML